MPKLLSITILSGLIFSCTPYTTEESTLEPEENSELFLTIARMDSLYFSAQNACDLELYESYLLDDFEFFHDVGGFTETKKDEMAGMAIFCGEEQRSRQPLRRQIIESSLKVFPMNNYGALEHCDHEFYLQINDGTEKVVGRGKMTALWKLDSNEWKLARVISYDHETIAEKELSSEILNQYVGDYGLPDRIVNIKKEGKLLRITDFNDGEPGWTKELLPESETTFYLNFENVQYEFVKNGSAVEKLIIYENGEVYEEALKL